MICTAVKILKGFERLFIRYKGEAYPKGENIQTFCHRNNVPYNLFEKWYKDTRHKVVEVNVSDRPSQAETGKPKEEGQQKEGPATEVRILMDLRVSNGLHLHQGNLVRQIARYLPHHRSENASKTHPKSSHDKFKTAS